MKTNKVVLTLFLLMSILLSGCGKSAPPIEQNTEITVAETTAPSQTEKESIYQFSLIVENDRELTVFLQLSEIEDFDSEEVLEIQIYDGDQLLQTIAKENVPAVTDYAWDGLFLNEGNAVGLPDVRDLNFDGAEDFGLLAVSDYPQNVPYSYFFWNEEKGQFVYQLTAFGPGWLQTDDSEKRLVEVSNEGPVIYKKYFTIASDGSLLTQDTSFDNSPVTIDGNVYWGGSGPDGSPNRVSVTVSLASVIRGEEAYRYLLLNDPQIQSPGPGQEYIVIILNIKYEDGDLDILDMTENIARQPGYSLHFALPNETSNAIDVTYALSDPIYNIQLAKGESASGSVAFLQEIGNTQPLYFEGFGEITTFRIQ